ncbi:potassium voltage-gated channel protein Shaw-like isoform X3 [Mercenaria mercenaria]|uniref:potassium voltage-gated channel protein Shaw-like isoform X3 n=1 Tax=Mercenaria mercenaria TaxID=6596 RepID=UPI00234F23CE|nr:potassium voltage-gated channel protein Shaw-like isoform X3 [Mercenaria mercenaria]
MGVIHRNSGVFWKVDMDAQPRSKGGSRSPNLNGRSPSLMRASASSKRSRNRFSDSDYNISYNDFDERCSNENNLRGGRLGVTCNKCDNSERKGCETKVNSNDNMALSAVMLSGGSGGSGLKKGSSQRNLTDADCEQGNINAWQNGGQSSRGSRSHSVSPSSSKCNCDKGKSKETVIINVGGNVFETFRSTLKRFKTCKLSDEREMMKYFRPDKGDYFFDRDPYAFNIIMNYLRYGDLHLPTNLCGPALMREFQYWGIDEQEIERCCFQPYNTWKTQTKSLEKLEYDRKQSTTQTDLAHDRKSKSVWRRLRAVIWPFLQDPGSSVAAKIYAWISIIFVCLSIFSFCAETHPYFQLPPSEVHNLRVLYKFFALEDSQVITKINDNTGVQNSTASNLSDSAADTNNTDVDSEQKIQHPALLVIDLICVLFFSLEFLTRLVFCPKKLRFCTSLQNIIDFIAIVPDYVEFILLCVSPQVRSGLSFVDFIFILRMLRLCRIFRLIRHVPGLWILLYTLKASFNELLLMFVFLLIGMVMFASLLHFTEGGGQFSNIPVGFWWAVVTMTTVGYGDMYPTSAFGYFIGSICAISGLLMIAFTVPIIVSNFVLYYTHVQYGISDKDERDEERCDVNDIETCSYHTSCSGSINDVHKSQNPTGNSQTTESDINMTEIRDVPRSNSETTTSLFDKDENIPMKITDSNSNRL